LEDLSNIQFLLDREIFALGFDLETYSSWNFFCGKI